MRHARSLLLRVTLLASSLGAEDLALAQSPLDAAREQFNIGAQAYSSARYELAVSSLTEAYRLAPRPEILFSLAQAEKKQCIIAKDAPLLKKALAHYRQYLAEVPASGRRSDAVDAITYLEQLATTPDFGGAAASSGAAAVLPTKLAVYSSVDGAHVHIDGRSQGDVPFVGPVTPGKHRVRLSLEGFFDVERDVIASEGVSTAVPITLVERPVPLVVVTGARAELYVDGTLVGQTPFMKPVEIAPGPHVLVAVQNGKRLFTRDLTVERGKPARVQITMETSGQRVASYVVLGAGAATLVASGVFFGIALAEEARAQNREEQRQAGTLQPGGLVQENNAIANRDAFRSAGAASAIGGLLVLGAGAALYLVDKPDPRSVPLRLPEDRRPKPRTDFEVGAAPLLGPGVSGLGVFGRF